jgi:hypothetical protein
LRIDSRQKLGKCDDVRLPASAGRRAGASNPQHSRRAELHEDEAGLLAMRLLFRAERLLGATDATARMSRRRT